MVVFTNKLVLLPSIPGDKVRHSWQSLSTIKDVFLVDFEYFGLWMCCGLWIILGCELWIVLGHCGFWVVLLFGYYAFKAHCSALMCWFSTSVIGAF